MGYPDYNVKVKQVLAVLNKGVVNLNSTLSIGYFYLLFPFMVFMRLILKIKTSSSTHQTAKFNVIQWFHFVQFVIVVIWILKMGEFKSKDPENPYNQLFRIKHK